MWRRLFIVLILNFPQTILSIIKIRTLPPAIFSRPGVAKDFILTIFKIEKLNI